MSETQRKSFSAEVLMYVAVGFFKYSYLQELIHLLEAYKTLLLKKKKNLQKKKSLLIFHSQSLYYIGLTLFV